MSPELFTRQQATDRPAGVWDYVSASRLNLWLKCPLAFRLRYVDGVESPVSPAQFVGKRVHAALECYYRHRQLGLTIEPDQVALRISDDWGDALHEERVEFADTAEEETAFEQTQRLVAAYLAQVPAAEPQPLAVEAAIEAPLVDPQTSEDLGLPLVGIIDLVLPEADGPTIADFKTSARGGQPLEVTHEVQLSSYSYLYRYHAAEPEGALEIRSLAKTKTPRIECYRYAPREARHVRRLFAVIRAYLDALDSGRFVFRPGWGCSKCEFRGLPCSSWCG
ncbi:MAG: RecB family exonuclease [Pirellulales bacterium]